MNKKSHGHLGLFVSAAGLETSSQVPGFSQANWEEELSSSLCNTSLGLSLRVCGHWELQGGLGPAPVPPPSTGREKETSGRECSSILAPRPPPPPPAILGDRVKWAGDLGKHLSISDPAPLWFS